MAHAGRHKTRVFGPHPPSSGTFSTRSGAIALSCFPVKIKEGADQRLLWRAPQLFREGAFSGAKFLPIRFQPPLSWPKTKATSGLPCVWEVLFWRLHLCHTIATDRAKILHARAPKVQAGAQRAGRGISMLQDNCRETIFAAQLLRTLPRRRDFERKINALS